MLHPGRPDQNEVQQNQMTALHGQNQNTGSGFQWHKKNSLKFILVGWLLWFLFLIFFVYF